RVKTKMGAQFLTVSLGLLIFIDDYFNSLTVGAVSRPITDRYRISRAKLAYLIDSTSAPICVIAPISSWGAYIIGLIGSILFTYNLAGESELVVFIKMIPLNLYVIFTFMMVFFTIRFDLNLGKMKEFEMRAQNAQIDRNEEQTINEKGHVRDLLDPIVTLVVTTFVMMFLTGLKANDWSFNLFAILENADVYLSLFIASLLGFFVSVCRGFVNRSVSGSDVKMAVGEGSKSMIHAVVILISAWMLTAFISDLGTGAYVASVFKSWNVSVEFMPVIVFIISAVMAFATGTSWGTFGMMLPIAAQMVMVSDPEWLLPALAAVLAGAVCGDHCSPISDTTILSSTGAGCDHIEHVESQLPYAMISAFVSATSYLILGLTGNYFIALGCGVLLLVGTLLFIRKIIQK
ncbi:MAG: Na+/H+ antiporter NhaC family protein, partial [Bacilli bacterium]